MTPDIDIPIVDEFKFTAGEANGKLLLSFGPEGLKASVVFGGFVVLERDYTMQRMREILEFVDDGRGDLEPEAVVVLAERPKSPTHPVLGIDLDEAMPLKTRHEGMPRGTTITRISDRCEEDGA